MGTALRLPTSVMEKENKYINKHNNQKKYDFIFEGPGPVVLLL